MTRAAAEAIAQPQRTGAQRRCARSPAASPAASRASSGAAAQANRHRSIRLFPPTHVSLADDLQRRLAGRYIVECGGEGNCLFHVVSFLAYDRPDEHRQLRHAVADWLRDAQHAQHPVVMQLQAELALDGGIDGFPVRSLDEYASYIRQSGVAGSMRYELAVLAELLQLEIHVVVQQQVPAQSAAADQLRDCVVMPQLHPPLRRVDVLYANLIYHYQALVCPEDVPALVASSCRCKGQCECDPANHLFYNLSVGSGPSRQRFARQRKAIAAELEHSRWTRLLADMPYHVRTVAPKASCPQPVDTRLAPSNLQTSGQSVLLGVFPTHGQPPITAALTQSTAEQARRARFVTHYGGWLVPDTLLDTLQHRVYVCTAVRVDALAYHDAKKNKRVAVSVVGDPESTGPQINDGRISKKAVNCHLTSVSESEVARVRTPLGGKLAISHDAVWVERVESGALDTWDELLISYDTPEDAQDGYWTRQAKAAPHCLMCFRLDCAPNDQLIKCEVDGCKVARHRNCLPAPTDPASLITEAVARRTRFRCAPHFYAAKQADPKLGVSSPTALDGLCLPTVAEMAAKEPTAAAARPRAPAEGRPNTHGGLRVSADTTRQATGKCVSEAPTPLRASAGPKPPPARAGAVPCGPNASAGLEDIQSAARAAAAATGQPPRVREYSWRSSAGPSSPSARASALAQVFGSGLTSRGGAEPQPNSARSPPSVAPAAAAPIDSHAAAAAAAAAADACDDDDLAPDIDLFDEEDVNSEFEDGDWSGSDESDVDDWADSDEDVDARITRSIVRQVKKAARHAEHSARDPLTGERSRHRALSVRPAARAHPDSATLTAAQRDEQDADRVLITATNEQEIRRLLNDKVVGKLRGKAPWFLKTELQQLPHWDEYRKLQASDRSNAEEQAALKAELKRAQSGRALWLSTLQIAKDWQEYSRCCGSLRGSSARTTRLLAHLAGSTVHSRSTHASASVVHFMAKRIDKRAAFGSKQEFTAHVCAELEASVQVPDAATGQAQEPLVVWDGCAVCHSCYRAALGIGRTSLFKFKAKTNMQANVRVLEKAQMDARNSQHPLAKHYPRIIALAKKAADRPIYKQRAEACYSLVKALLLEYCRSFAQHDPGAAGSSKMRTRYTLPQHNLPALHSALNADFADRIHTRRELDPDRWELQLPPADKPPPASGEYFSKSTLGRVIKHLRQRCNVCIQLTKQKGVCRCTICDELQASIAKTAVGSPERQLVQAHLDAHLDTVKAQRKLFDKQKAEALQKPLELWTITFDGFDKSKTAIPHRPRFNKEQASHVDSLIGMHVVGVFAFGAPVPVLAFFNDESVAGGANLSATIVYEVLEKQWQKLVRDYLQQRNPHVPAEQLDEMHVSAEQLSDAHSYAASKWPRRLHLTFDNTSGEAKNTTFFKAMAALVHYGVFEAITMSMLLVGHTHDIVDQMFSVWAVVLRITSVPTLRAMKDLFRRCYRTRLKALSELFAEGQALFDPPQQAYDEHGQELPVPDAANKTAQLRQRLAKMELFSLEAFQAFFRESAKERHDPTNQRTKKWQKDDFDFAAQTMHELDSVTPELFDIEHSIDFDNWFKSNPSVGSTMLSHISKSYVFGIEKWPTDRQGEGEPGATYLFTRHLANTIEEAGAFPEQRHHYRKQLTGDYSTRKMIFPAEGQFSAPPCRTLARVVDSAAIELMLSVFAKDGLWLTPLEYEENRAHLQRMQDKATAQADQCDVCSDLMQRLKAIGIISRKDTHTPAEKKLAAEKQQMKTAVLSEYKAHMLNAEFAVVHRPLELTRFWSIWIDRRDAIDRSFQARLAQGKIKQDSLYLRSTPYHRHPPELCSDLWEPSIFPDDERIDVRCLRANGPPRIGDVAVMRTSDINDAFLLGRITALHPDAAAAAKRLHERRDQQLMLAFRQQEPGIMRINTPALHPRLVSLDPRDAELLQRMQEVRRAALGLRSDDPLPPPPFEIRASHHACSPVGSPCSVGAFATRDIRRGEFIDFYSIFITHSSEYFQDRRKSRTHVLRMADSDDVLDGLPMASAITRFVADSDDAKTRLQMLPASAFEPLAMYSHMALSDPAVAGVLRRFGDLPKGCLLNSAFGLPSQQHRTNCTRETNTRDFTLAGGSQMKHPLASVPYIQAARDIAKGEELLCIYNNNEEKKRAWRAHTTEDPPGAAAAIETVRDQLLARAREQEDEAERWDLSLLPKMTVHFFHYYSGDMQKLGYNNAYWKRRWTEHFAKLERARAEAAKPAAANAGATASQTAQPQPGSTAAAAAATAAADASSEPAAPPDLPPARDLTDAELAIAKSEMKPPWLVEDFKILHFVPSSAKNRASRKDAREVTAAMLLYWGPEDKVVTGDRYVKLRDDVYEQVLAHLTGAREVAVRGARPRALAAAKADAGPRGATTKSTTKRKQKSAAAAQPASAGQPHDNEEPAAAAAAAAGSESSAAASPSKKRRVASPAAAAKSAAHSPKPRKRQPARATAKKDRYCESDSDESASTSGTSDEEGSFSEQSETSSRSRRHTTREDEDESAPLSSLTRQPRLQPEPAPDECEIEYIDTHEEEGGAMWYLVKWVGFELKAADHSGDWFKRDSLPRKLVDAYDKEHNIVVIAKASRKRKRKRQR